MIGLDLYTAHQDGALCNDTTGVYVRHGQWAGGVLKTVIAELAHGALGLPRQIRSRLAQLRPRLL